ncbi:huntingtin [Anticarsia gemmatalis]|uniref:huntingtin n=1 Tax=Anticarsia gemmatalis TaxID=129554 RepID=UPI003F75D7D6
MNVLEKAEKALEFLKANESTAKSHELQAAAATLGRCLGALGSRSNCARHYANLLHSAVPTLLLLASNDSAEIRLVGDEALNRAVVGGFAFHSHKTNIIIQNQIEPTKNARWIRAAISRICLGDCWLRPGVGKIRTQAQSLFPKLSQIVRQTSEIQLIVEALENNLPRILTALAEYTTDEEISELSKALLGHVETSDPVVRRGISNCVAHLCSHREPLLTSVLGRVFEKLWPPIADSSAVMGWFCVIKAIFQINDISKFSDNDLFSVQDYLELYHLCIHYIAQAQEHNVQNAVMECFTPLLSLARGHYKCALLLAHPPAVSLHERQKAHRRNISTSSVISSRYAPSPTSEVRDPMELSFSGALQLGSLLQFTTPSLSVEDLTIQTPDSPASDTDIDLPTTEQLTKDLSEKLQEIEEDKDKDEPTDTATTTVVDGTMKVNIGSADDDDVPLKYCARLLASKFLLTGNKGGVIPDRSIRVSLKSSALNCLSELLRLYPQAMTLYLDKDADAKSHNISGSSEGTDSNQDHINDFILERNVCYQDSLTDSLSQDLLNRSMDSQQTSHQISKKDSKSESTEQKSLKDVPSNILDSKLKDMGASMNTDSTNPNMTNSNFTTNSNMTASNDPLSTGYPMSSSGDILSSSIDLDMKFDHFGESTTNLDNLDALKDFEKKEERVKRPLKRTDEVQSKEVVEICSQDLDEEMKNLDENKSFEYQHLSDVFLLLEGHNDPQIRGLVRVCIGNYLVAALDASHGDYHRWRSFSLLPKEVSEFIAMDKLVEIVLKGLSDTIHSTVNHTLSTLTSLSTAICNSTHWTLIIDILNALVNVEANTYWLCRVNLCKLYEKLPYQKLFMLYPNYYLRSKLIMDTLVRMLMDQDQKVRNAASQTIANIIPTIHISRNQSPTTTLGDIAKRQTRDLSLSRATVSLELVRRLYFYSELPAHLRHAHCGDDVDAITVQVAELVAQLMKTHCKFYTQGLLEALQAVCRKWPPWKFIEAYSDQGLLSYCLDSLDCCNGSVMVRTILMELCSLLYPVEIHNIMRHKTANRDIFERDTQNSKDRWQHLENDSVASLSEKFLQVTLKMLNVLVHLIEEVNPNVHLNKGGIALPGSPVRRKTSDAIPRRGSNPSDADDKGSLRKKLPVPASSLKANFQGHFYNEPFYMKFYDALRATYSNHKINLDPKSSIFHTFLSTVLDCVAIQLELATEKEIGNVTEEILYYLKVIMPLCADKTVNCITQLLKCLFGTNMVNQYSDYMSILDKIEPIGKSSIFHDVLLPDKLLSMSDSQSRRSSVCSNASQKMSLDSVNPQMMVERKLLITMENFAKNKSDRKWSTNKKELERYIRLFEPVVIQALKTYTMQNDIPLQCEVLSLLNQLLTLRVNYCMLDSDQIFIGFLMKQLDLVEQHEIPNCCELVNSILMFMVQLSSSKHHTKQIIEIPKLIQLCDGLMASGAHAECIAGLEPVAVKVFSNMGGASVLGRAKQQEAQATREVLFYMLQKTMHEHKVLDLVSCLLAVSQEHPESYYRWSELACDTLLQLLSQTSVEVECVDAVGSLERLLDSMYRHVLLEQSRLEMMLKILFKAPPDQATTPLNLKVRYLSIIMVLLRKLLVLIPETEILLSINDLKSTSVSPQSIFFNVKTDVDPLNVQNVNENCANLSPDVILVRFLFKTLTYAIVEMGNVYEDLDKELNKLLYSVCVNIIIQVKHMLHLTDGCLFPLTAKTAQTILHNEQSGLNTGLYSPEENIPLDVLNVICLKSAYRIPLLTVHWSHLLIRLNFLSHKYWQKLVGFSRGVPLSAHTGDTQLLRVDILQVACVMAYCEYFVENGLSEAVHLTWLLVNRVHILVSQYREDIVQSLIAKVQLNAGASGLLLQAVAARCQSCLKDEFALNTYKILSLCHESQSGPLVFLICRIINKLEPAIAVRFANLAMERCKMLKEMPVDQINVQLSKEDVQVALELLQRNKVHTRYTALVMELNSLASSVFDLSPLDLSQDRAINPQNILTTQVDSNWLLNQVKNRCCQADSNTKLSKQSELAQFLANLPKDDLSTVMTCPEFDRKLIGSCFKITCDNYLREFLNILSVQELKEYEKETAREQKEMKIREEMSTSIDSNKLNVVNTLHVFKKSDNKESKSQFFIPITDSENLKENFGNLQITDEDFEIELPELSDLYKLSIATLEKSLVDIIKLFPKQIRPLSQSENFSLNVEQTIDRYTRRCHQVFQDKLFYQEFITIQTILSGFLASLSRLLTFLDETDCDLLDKCIENIIPTSLAKNIAIFAVISLQYLSFLIKNKKIVETPVHTDVSFRVTASVTDNVVVDHVVGVTIENVAKALSVKEIWMELNTDGNVNRTQSAVSCLYAVVKYLVKDTKPLIAKQYMQSKDTIRSDMVITGDKLITLLEYWQMNDESASHLLAHCYVEPLESLLVSLSRLDIMSNIALIPPIAWSSVEVVSKKDQLEKIDLPLQALQDMDVLEAFLYRVNLIGWSSKKQFEEMWVGLLGALQGNGTHWAVRGITQLLLSAAPAVRGRMLHVPRHAPALNDGMQRLRTILVGTSAYSIFDNVNLERVPMLNDGFDGYHCAQFSTEYLKLAAEISNEASYRVRRQVKRVRRNKDIDINSCLQILMDVTAQMLEPKASTGVCARVALLGWLCCAPGVLLAGDSGAMWARAAAQLVALTGAAHHALTQHAPAARALLLALSHAMCVLDGLEPLQVLYSTGTGHVLLALTGAAHHALTQHAPAARALLLALSHAMCVLDGLEPLQVLYSTGTGHVLLALTGAAHHALTQHAPAARALLLALSHAMCVLDGLEPLQVLYSTGTGHVLLALTGAAHHALTQHAPAARALLLALSHAMCVLDGLEPLQVLYSTGTGHVLLALTGAAHHALTQHAPAARALLLALSHAMCVLDGLEPLQVLYSTGTGHVLLALTGAAHHALTQHAPAARALLLALSHAMCVLDGLEPLQVLYSTGTGHVLLALTGAAHHALTQHAPAARALLLALSHAMCVLDGLEPLQVLYSTGTGHVLLALTGAAHHALTQHAPAARALLLALSHAMCVLDGLEPLQVLYSTGTGHVLLALTGAAHHALTQHAPAARALLLALSHAMCVLDGLEPLQVLYSTGTGHVLLALTGAAHHALTQHAPAARALLLALSHAMCVLDGLEPLQELSTVHQKLVKSLSSSYAPLRHAALQGCLLQLSGRARHMATSHTPNPYQELVAQLNVAVKQYLAANAKISLYEQSLYWTVLFTLIELGHPELINIAVDFVLTNPRHYCIDLVVKGITSTIRQQVLPKDLKNAIIEKLIDNMKNYSEHHAVQILMVHLFSADNKLLSPKLTSDVSNMDPDILMNSMERITLLYKVLRHAKHNETKRIITNTIQYFLRETLPPAATLSRVVIEFIECCKDTEKIRMDIACDKNKWIDSSVMNSEIVFEVFETSITQDQLPVLSGWIFEALCHLLNGKIASNLLPYCLLTLLVSASSNEHIRKITPLTSHILRLGFQNPSLPKNWGMFENFLNNKVSMSFSDRRLLCVVALKSGFSGSQFERLKELCDSNDCLNDVAQCLEI